MNIDSTISQDNRINNKSNFNNLFPKMKRSQMIQWKPEDDEKLLHLVELLGHKWIEIVKYFPGLTQLQIKNHWYSNIRKMKRKMVALSEKKEMLAIKQSQKKQKITIFKDSSNEAFWDEHLNEETFLKECYNIYLEMSS